MTAFVHLLLHSSSRYVEGVHITIVHRVRALYLRKHGADSADLQQPRKSTNWPLINLTVHPSAHSHLNWPLVLNRGAGLHYGCDGSAGRHRQNARGRPQPASKPQGPFLKRCRHLQCRIHALWERWAASHATVQFWACAQFASCFTLGCRPICPTSSRQCVSLIDSLICMQSAL